MLFRSGERATIGGMVAANQSGPRRHRYGTPRDLIIGIEVALTSGLVARSGGRVVKNVAGYDLARLFCGSYGSLGLITSVTFKLAPLPASSRTVVARFATVEHAAAAARDLAASPSLTPSAIELLAPDPRLLVRFESTERSADLMASAAEGMIRRAATSTAVLRDGPEAAAWTEHERTESMPGGLVGMIAVLPTAVGPAAADLARHGAAHGVTWALTGRAALGVLRVHASGTPEALQRFARELRAAIAAHGGRVQFAGASDILGTTLDRHGSLGSSAGVALAVKQRFDPAGVLPYPWTAR